MALKDAPAVPDTRLLRSFRSTVEQDRRQAENLKIACGRKHFELSKDVVFKDVGENPRIAGEGGFEMRESLQPISPNPDRCGSV